MRFLLKFLPTVIAICITLCLLTACETLAVPPQTGIVVRHIVLTGSGCGRSLGLGLRAGMSENEVIDVAGLPRIYRIHVPEDYRPRVKLPLILNFHGHGSNMLVQEQMSGMSRLANREGFVVAYPQGSIGPDGRPGWNTGPRRYPHVNDILFTNDVISNIESQLCINAQRVYAVGFSNGGSFTGVLACKLAGRIAAVAIASGGMHPVAGGCSPRRPIALMEFHGTSDRVAPYDGNHANDDEPPIQQWMNGWAQRDGCQGRPATFYGGRGVGNGLITGEQWSTCKDNVSVVHYRISGGTHNWPQGSFVSPPQPGKSGKFSHVSTSYSDASTIMWQFLQRFTLP